MCFINWSIIIDKTIFVSIASYNDPLLFFTINELITKATNPDKLRIGVIDQNHIDQRNKINKLDYAKQIRYMHVNLIDTLGACWARNLAFSLYDNEEYLLQIDSHMCFLEGWDVTFIEQHTKLLEKSPKPILSTYPHVFDIINGEPVYNKHIPNNYALIIRPVEKQRLKNSNPLLLIRSRIYVCNEPQLGAFIACGFIFCNGNFIEEIPYDPYFYFHGEEQSISIRAYTHGWDIYHPVYTPIFHKYKIQNVVYSSQHWNGDFSHKRSIEYPRLLKRTTERFSRLVYGDGMYNSIYGLGTDRTLEDYNKLTGIDYTNKTITDLYVGKFLDADIK